MFLFYSTAVYFEANTLI